MIAPLQGEIWWAEAEDKRRPVLVVTRSEVIPVLTAIVVAPISRTIRAIPTEIPLSIKEGVEVECVATFDNIQRIHRSFLTSKIGDLGLRHNEICLALKALSNC